MPSKFKLLSFVCSTALVTPLLVVPAYGQSQNNTSVTDEADENIIVVTGRALDQQLSIEAKREAKQVVDVLTADQANQLPDNNVAESLSRIPGVSVVRSGETGNGNFISVRGLDSALVNVQFNGINSGTANGGNRSVPLDGITSDDIAEIRVSKSLLPQDEGVGVGGAINIIARTPLNGGKDQFKFNASGRYGEFSDKFGYDFGGSFTKIFSDSFGISFSASYRRRFIKNFELDASSSNIAFLDSLQNAAGQTLSPAEIIALGIVDAGTDYDNLSEGIIGPENITFEEQSYQLQQQTRDTLTLSGSIDWRPTDSTLLTLGGRFSERRTDATEFSITFDDDDGDLELVGNQLVTEFGDPEIDVEAQLEDQYNLNANAFLKSVTETDKIKLEVLLSYARAEERAPQTDLFFDTNSLLDSSVQFQPYSFLNKYFPVPNANVANDASFIGVVSDIPGSVDFDGFETDLINRSINDRYAAKLDFTYDVDQEFFGGSITNVRVGGKYERSDVREDKFELVDEVDGVNLDGSYDSGGNGSADGETLSNIPGLFNGFVSLSDIGSPLSSIGIDGIPVLNAGALRSFVDNFQSSFLASGDDPNNAPEFFDSREETFAGYFQAEIELGNLDLSGGFRVEHYKGRFASPLTLDANIITVNGGTNQTIDIGQATTLDTVNSSTRNTEILPRFNARYKINDQLQVRGGVGYSIARPTFAQLGTATEVDITLEADGDVLGTPILPGVTDAAGAVAAGGLNINQITEAGISISSGNPNLKNARSLNLDLSLEYFPMRGTAITLGLFHKRIKNFIFLGQESGSGALETAFVQDLLSADGQSLLDGVGGLGTLITAGADVDVSQPTNGSLAKVSGIEFGISHQFKYLPGFLSNMGMNANITYTDSNAQYTLVAADSALNPGGGLSDDEAEVVLGFANEGDALIRRTSFFRAPEITANGTLFYQDDDFDIALSGSYQTESFTATDDFGLDQFTGSYFQLDLFVGYTLPVPKNYGEFKIFFEVPDITDGGRKPTDLQTVGRSRTVFDEASFNGREFRFGLRGKF